MAGCADHEQHQQEEHQPHIRSAGSLYRVTRPIAVTTNPTANGLPSAPHDGCQANIDHATGTRHSFDVLLGIPTSRRTSRADGQRAERSWGIRPFIRRRTQKSRCVFQAGILRSPRSTQ